MRILLNTKIWSINKIELPSTSIIIEPSALSINTGKAVPSEADTASALRLINCSDFGPGIAVTKLRFCAIGFFASEYMRKC